MGDDHSPQRFVPFSWENKPGVSKVVDEEVVGVPAPLKLPPPPGPPPSHGHKSLIKMIRQGEPLHVPLPPGAFDQRPMRSLSKRGFKVEDDPFLLAYKECTKTGQTRREKKSSKAQSSASSTVRTLLGYFSCRASSRSVRDTVRIPPPQPRLLPSDADDFETYKS